MKGTRRSKVWLALGLVAMACLVLAGCPHNNLLDSSGGGGAGNGGGGRGGSDGVQLVVTNFVDGGPVASRSIGWLGGPQRTIAPEHIDLTVEDEIKKYVFVASATGDGTWGPTFVDISSGTGAATLDGLGSGTWEVTLEAYDVQKLNGQGAIQGTTKEDIMEQDTPDEVKALKNIALVLSGGATVDTNSGAQVTLTLTKDRVDGSGTVDVAVYFTNQTDVQEIFTNGKYKVTAELVDPLTWQQVPDSEVILFEKKDPPAQDTDTDPKQAFEYRVYNTTNGLYEMKQVESVPQNQKKVLEYKPTTGGAGASLTIPKGKYLLRVTVTNLVDGSTLQRIDPDTYVDPNVELKDVFEIDGIIGVKPNALADFDVYWSKPGTADQLDGYTATFVWKGNDYRASGYTIELADITSIYKYDGGQTKVKTDVEHDFTNAAILWEKLDAHPDTFNKHVTTLDWRTTPQANTSFPKWEGGFLLQGNTRLDLRLQSGHVYSARIRASNGSSLHSDWTYIGSGTTTAPTPPGTATKFEIANTKGIFDLVKIAYNLQGTMDMYTLLANRNTDWQVQGDTKVAGEALLQVAAYTPGTPIDLAYGFEGETVNAVGGDQVLTVSGQTDIVRSWLGWQDTKTKGLFGPVSAPARVPAWTKADWEYSGYTDLELTPVGAGGSNINVKAETAGTFDVISKDTVGFSTAQPDGAAESKILNDLTQFTQGQTTPDIYRNAGTTRLVAVIGGTQRLPTPAFTLHVSVGKNDTVVKSPLEDKNGNTIEVVSLEAQVFGPGSATSALRTASGFTAATGDVPAYVVFENGESLAGLRAGDGYTLMVRATMGQGFTASMQIPMTILYADQVANATIP